MVNILFSMDLFLLHHSSWFCFLPAQRSKVRKNLNQHLLKMHWQVPPPGEPDGAAPRAGRYLETSASPRQEQGSVQSSPAYKAPAFTLAAETNGQQMALFRVGLELILCVRKRELSGVAPHKGCK